jgi:hypothetical protein
MANDVTTRSAHFRSASLATYASPRLVVYGSLAEITRKVGVSSKMDGGAVNGMKNSQK